MRWSRRAIVAAGVALFSQPKLWQARADDAELTPKDLDDLFTADGEVLPPGFGEAKPVTRWIELTKRPEPQWSDRQHSIDYSHFSETRLDGKSFQLTSQVLTALASQNHFDVAGNAERILFGLRGCALVDEGPVGFVKAVEVIARDPDHLNNNCILGVWNKDDDKVWISAGSTVPNVDYMW